MKKAKKTALIAAAFIASMNLNGCAYGPSPYYEDETEAISEAASDGEAYQSEENQESNDNDPSFLEELYDSVVQQCAYGPPPEMKN